MATMLTGEQVLTMAPDAAAVAAARPLANARTWRALGRSDRAAWGECKGSAKEPYQTRVDLADTASKCSCPSRKFPCKHALALLLYLAAEPGAFMPGDAPEWVATWLASRDERARKAPRHEQLEHVPDEAAREKRATQRQARVDAGLADLELWLRDLVRAGLAQAQAKPYPFWDAPAARLVDAQAPGVARMVRDLAGVVSSGSGWPERLANGVGRLFLLLEAYRRIDELDPSLQADVRALVGWAPTQEDALAQPGVRDRWLVLGRRVEELDQLVARRTWLRGASTGRDALLLQFHHPSQAAEPAPVIGACLDAELAFFPSAFPQRALVKATYATPAACEGISGYPSVAAALGAYAAALARQPWLARFPMAIEQVMPVPREEGWAVRDVYGRLLWLDVGGDLGWQVLAIGGGSPTTLVGEWDGRKFLPLAVWAERRYVALAILGVT